MCAVQRLFCPHVCSMNPARHGCWAPVQLTVHRLHELPVGEHAVAQGCSQNWVRVGAKARAEDVACAVQSCRGCRGWEARNEGLADDAKSDNLGVWTYHANRPGLEWDAGKPRAGWLSTHLLDVVGVANHQSYQCLLQACRGCGREAQSASIGRLRVELHGVPAWAQCAHLIALLWMLQGAGCGAAIWNALASRLGRTPSLKPWRATLGFLVLCWSTAPFQPQHQV